MALPLTTRRLWPSLLFVLLWTGICPGAPADPAEFTYRTSVNEVRLSFSVLDQNNRGVATLQASDFAIVDKDFIVRDFQSFSRTDWTKLDLAIVIDSSESVSPQFNRELATIVDMVSETTGIPDENLSIFSFEHSQPILVCAGNCRIAHTLDHLPSPCPGALTPLYDTVVFAADFLGKHGDPQAQRVLILFSDGNDTVSRNSAAEAMSAAQAHDIRIYAVDLNHGTGDSDGSSILLRISDGTGGRSFAAQSRATDTLNAILEGFRATYRVTYRLPIAARGFHTVRILPTRNLNLQFRSRAGYYYPNPDR